jgi:hypothetical protein
MGSKDQPRNNWFSPQLKYKTGRKSDFEFNTHYDKIVLLI